MNRQAMIQRVAHAKVAQMEKEAIFSLLKELPKVLSSIPRSVVEVAQGAREEDIARQIKQLRKDEKFMQILEEAPKRSSFKKLWDHFYFSLRQTFKLSNATIAVIAIIAILVTVTGSIGLLLGSGQLGSVVGLILSFPFTTEGGPTSHEMDNNAREIAKHRLRNSR
jgi:hypothetical protein